MKNLQEMSLNEMRKTEGGMTPNNPYANAFGRAVGGFFQFLKDIKNIPWSTEGAGLY